MTNNSPLPNITDSPPDEERMNLIKLTTQDAAKFLGLKLDTDSPDVIVKAVNDCVRGVKKGGGPAFPEDEEVHLLLECLWGTQLVRALKWEWANIVFHDPSNFKAVGVVSPSRDMVIYPFQFVSACIKNNAIVTILLSYNMLKERMGNATFPPRSYVNVMDRVHHIIPPEE